ncbi:uncharacterized protein TNCV_4050581 [Trichonephila clavipes]|nr:uncharacterized protein TNCV_4050581 [Trichonephila clavipes]
MDGRSPSPRNFFKDLYLSNTQAMIRRKEEMVKVEGYLVRGITQFFNCNNFYHTAANCHMRPRCLKCGKDHASRNCHIKERQENPFCINCQGFGHSACYTKCPNSPNQKRHAPLFKPKFSKSRTSESQIEDRRLLAQPRFLLSKSSVILIPRDERRHSLLPEK